MPRRTASIALLAALALLVGCSTGNGSSSATTATTTNPTSPSVQTTEPIQLEVATTPLGDILVDGDGRTLYAFVDDTGGVPTCTGTCAQAWPPLTADTVNSAAELDSANIGLAPLADGSSQLVYLGHPLYRFGGDTAPGETNGQGLNGKWFVVGTDGQLITTPAG